MEGETMSEEEKQEERDSSKDSYFVFFGDSKGGDKANGVRKTFETREEADKYAVEILNTFNVVEVGYLSRRKQVKISLEYV
jgi:hypothetical protein